MLRTRCVSFGHLQKYLNVLFLPFKVLHKHCFYFLLGQWEVPRETGNNAYAKFWRANKEYFAALEVATNTLAFVTEFFSPWKDIIRTFPEWEVKAKNRCYESYERLKWISYSHTIIGKTVGKVSTFEVFFASLPTPLIQCCAKLNGFSGKLLFYPPTLNRGRGAI